MLGCADRSLLSYYEEDVSATELAIYSGCRESLRLLGPDVNGNVMRSFHDDDAVGIRRHPVVIASGLAKDCLEELFAQMDGAERSRWPKTLQVLRCKQCGTDCASVPAWRSHKCTSAPRQVVFNTGSTGRVFYCRLCPRIAADAKLSHDRIFQHVIDEHASDERLPFEIVSAMVPGSRKRKRCDDQ
jgi:hypothetical protein